MDQLPGIIWDATTRLFSCGKVHAAYVYKLEENLALLNRRRDRLQNMAADVNTIIDDAERMGEKKRTNEVGGWLQEVGSLRKAIGDINNQGSQEMHNKCLCNCCPKNCVSSYKLGKRVVKMLNDVEELVASGEIFVKDVGIAFKLPLKKVVEMPPVDTVGLELMLDKVWRSIEDENVGIIGLYGMGGAGKTTLLKRINNEFGKRNHNFDVVLWVVVSRDCDTDKIMNDIRNRLGISDDKWKKGSSTEQRASMIYEVLKEKKFVLMLDDIWGKLELETVGVPHPKDTNNQSKILFTTRSKDVCAKMQAQKKFKVECLSEQEAFHLFCTKVGEETLKCHREIRKLARELANECSGLPLALITVASAMAGVDNVEAWRQATRDLSSSSWIALDSEQKVFSILKFSYDRLPDETHKSCFLYCALYPEDYEVGVEDLIDRWIGEGFLGEYNTKSIYDLYEKGKSIIGKLKLSCLLEGVEMDNWWPAIKMHDVIRDMALWLSRDQDGNKDKVVVQGEALTVTQMDYERLNAVERISIELTGARVTWQIPACPNLSTLCVRGKVNVTDFSNLQSMKRLKVLDLSGQTGILTTGIPTSIQLPKEIGRLINLEFLNLSGRKIHNELDFKYLKNLRIFIMDGVWFDLGISILKVISSFERLKVFRFYMSASTLVSGGEKALLEKLESLPELEELCIQLETNTGLEKLLKSTKLQGYVRRMMLRAINVPIIMHGLLYSLSKMKHLDEICLTSLHNIMEGSSITDTYHLCKLRKVEIRYCHSITHLTWLKDAPCVESLMVIFCESIEEVVKGAKNEDEDGAADIGNASDIFSNLKHLRLVGLLELRSIHKKVLSFPFLKLVRIQGCPNLRKLPFNSNSAKDNLNVIEGELDWWNNLEWEDTATKEALQSKFQAIRRFKP